MTPSEKENWRWRFAGQAMQVLMATVQDKESTVKLAPAAVVYANALIAALEKTVPKQEAAECEHGWVNLCWEMGEERFKCEKCGKFKWVKA